MLLIYADYCQHKAFKISSSIKFLTSVKGRTFCLTDDGFHGLDGSVGCGVRRGSS